MQVLLKFSSFLLYTNLCVLIVSKVQDKGWYNNTYYINKIIKIQLHGSLRTGNLEQIVKSPLKDHTESSFIAIIIHVLLYKHFFLTAFCFKCIPSLLGKGAYCNSFLITFYYGTRVGCNIMKIIIINNMY